MKKILLIVFTIIFITGGCAFADGDLWDNMSGDHNSYGQKPVSDEEFNSVVEKLKQKKFGKKKNKNIPKGESYRQSNETDFINKVDEDLPVLCIPVPLQADVNHVIPIGHYQIVGEKINGEPVIKLYQAHYLIAQLPACETKDDFGQKYINFVELLPEEENKVKIIFGNIDFNAYTILDIAKIDSEE